MNKRALFTAGFAKNFGRTWLVAGFLFLYLPMLTLVVFSFNHSRLPSHWGGFSLEWYAKLADDHEIINGLWLSFKIALLSACGSVVLGTMAAFSLVKYKRFFGRTLFSGMVSAPLVMPEVITGLSLLLLFVAFAPLPFVPDERGFSTIVIAHVTLTMAYVAVIVQSRLSSLDESLEEAAMDLGAPPARVFLLITLPIVAPAIASGWLLAFTLSLDDLVITTFTAGPSTTTLPMMIFSKVRLGVTPEINALATLMITLVAILVVTSSVLIARKEKSRERDLYLAQGAV
jgi:putrescine transport system permease protein